MGKICFDKTIRDKTNKTFKFNISAAGCKSCENIYDRINNYI